MQGRNYCFTFFFHEDESGFPKELPLYGRYMVYGFEICPDTKRPHLQGFVQFTQPVRMAHCQKFLKCSWFLCKGTPLENMTYCKKGGDFLEFGQPTSQGERSDLLAVKESIDTGFTLPQLWDAHFGQMTRYHRSFTVYLQIRTNNVQRHWQTRCLLLVGLAGMQKTTIADVLAPFLGTGIYRVPLAKSSGLYFDGYTGQEVVILDEMDGNRMAPTRFNDLIGHTPATVLICGAADVNWAPRYVIICSNYLPRYWWKKRSEEQQLQTTRRIHWTVPRLRPIKPKEACFHCANNGLCAFHHP